MFADRAKILSAPVKAATDMSVSAENYMYRTAVRTAAMAAVAEM